MAQLRLIEIDATQIKNELDRARVIAALGRASALAAEPFRENVPNCR